MLHATSHYVIYYSVAIQLEESLLGKQRNSKAPFIVYIAFHLVSCSSFIQLPAASGWGWQVGLRDKGSFTLNTDAAVVMSFSSQRSSTELWGTIRSVMQASFSCLLPRGKVAGSQKGYLIVYKHLFCPLWSDWRQTWLVDLNKGWQEVWKYQQLFYTMRV